MKKYYVDIEARYPESNYPNFSDHKNWKIEMIGILRLDIVDGNVINTEFDQYTAEINKLNLYEGFNRLVEIFENLSDDSIIVTWNGREFALPIIFQNLLELVGSLFITLDVLRLARKTVEYNRDLIDVAISKKCKIKGGLLHFAQMMRDKVFTMDETLAYEIDMLDTPEIGDIKMHKQAAKKFISLDNMADNTADNADDIYKIVKHKNKIDTKVLPEIEHYLGLLYEPLNDIDKTRHIWKYHKPVEYRLEKSFINDHNYGIQVYA